MPTATRLHHPHQPPNYLCETCTDRHNFIGSPKFGEKSNSGGPSATRYDFNLKHAEPKTFHLEMMRLVVTTTLAPYAPEIKRWQPGPIVAACATSPTMDRLLKLE